MSNCVQDTHSAGVLRSGVRYTPPSAKMATKKAAITTRTKSSSRPQSGSVRRSKPARTASPVFDVSTARVARKKTRTSAMPVQNQVLVNVALMG